MRRQIPPGQVSSSTTPARVLASTAELLCVLGVQSLPAVELHGIRAGDASDGVTGEMVIQHVEADVPTRSAHRDVVTVDVVPQRQPGAAASRRLELPADVLSTPAEFEQPVRVCALHLSLGYMRGAHRRELCATDRTEVPVGIERSPFAEMLGVGERLPDLCWRVAELADENQGPLLPIFSN